jgi:hypothetical protein
MKNFFRNISVGLGLAAIFTPGDLNASPGFVTENIAVPFEFRVDRLTLPAGEYRIEQDFGHYFVSIVNVRTGSRVQFLRDNSGRKPGRAKLIFEPTGQGYKLAKVS